VERTSAGVDPAQRRDEAADLGGEPHGLSRVGARAVVGRVGVVVRQGGGQRPQQIHRLGRRQRPQQADDALRQRPRDRKL
jgi:hypothetical protein